MEKLIEILAEKLLGAGLNAYLIPQDISAASWNEFRLKVAKRLLDNFVSEHIVKVGKAQSYLPTDEEYLKMIDLE